MLLKLLYFCKKERSIFSQNKLHYNIQSITLIHTIKSYSKTIEEIEK